VQDCKNDLKRHVRRPAPQSPPQALVESIQKNARPLVLVRESHVVATIVRSAQSLDSASTFCSRNPVLGFAGCEGASKQVGVLDLRG